MSSRDFHLDSYLRRIGIADAGAPTLALLHDVIAHHTATIPFENLDILLGRPILLDIASVQAKLVGRRRGGYCFEQNTLLRAALEALGFQVTSLMGRVVRGAGIGEVPPMSHLLLRVALPDGPMLADAGFGNLTATAPLAFGRSDAQPTLHEQYRLQEASSDTLLQVRLGTEWADVYRFMHHATFPIDHEFASWFTSTKPATLFTTNAIAARPGAGCRKTFHNGHVAIRGMENRVQRRTVTTETELRDTLHDEFGLELDTGEASIVCAAMHRFSEAAGAGGRWE